MQRLAKNAWRVKDLKDEKVNLLPTSEIRHFINDLHDPAYVQVKKEQERRRGLSSRQGESLPTLKPLSEYVDVLPSDFAGKNAHKMDDILRRIN